MGPEPFPSPFPEVLIVTPVPVRSEELRMAGAARAEREVNLAQLVSLAMACALSLSSWVAETQPPEPHQPTEPGCWWAGP